MEREYDAVIIGAGAAGLICAGFAAGRGLRVALLEQNDRPGRKLLITGKGRCNVTNDCDETQFLKAVRSGDRFLYSAIAAFPPRETMAFLEGLGLPLKTERGNRVFPKSDSARDVVDTLCTFIKRNGVHRVEGRARSILGGESGVTGVSLADGRVLKAPRVVIATGGLSYPRTGSTGDGYRMAQEVGHTLVPTQPSLIPIVTREDWCERVMGLSLRNVTLTVWEAGKKKPVYTELGEMLFTHFGVSGPLVLSASSHMDGGRLGDYRLEIDLKPGLTPQQLDARLLRDFEKLKNKIFGNALDELLPRALIPIVVEGSGIAGETKVHQITREQRQKLTEFLKALPLTPKAFRPVEEAIVTAGGVSLKEINPKTMESKCLPGLHFAGEVLDLDAYTGGYNLQIAFSTGFLAAQSL